MDLWRAHFTKEEFASMVVFVPEEGTSSGTRRETRAKEVFRCGRNAARSAVGGFAVGAACKAGSHRGPQSPGDLAIGRQREGFSGRNVGSGRQRRCRRRVAVEEAHPGSCNVDFLTN
ncbi:unnamed protein product [Prorocentrum cordatum]|uniref:Transposase n=1 Tax=Prorocentrum cordatum TaxID=2364126 RepID=A0ABN9TJK6_9DINO|nr:unnamed protein product [Polarella glacialis]